MIYNVLIEQLRMPIKSADNETDVISELSVKTGIFGAYMEVDSKNE